MKQTFEFLQLLEKNNNREWFQQNKILYEQSHSQMIQFAEELIQEMNKVDQIETSSGKRSLYRIYRDVRFGHDKTPYKNNWAGRLKRATDGLRGGYYYQIQPGNSFVIGGFFGPNPQDLLHIRKQIAQDSEPLREILNSKTFTGFFGELRGAKLKTSPKGFDKEHPDLDLLRYKQFMIRHDFSDAEVLSPNFVLTIASAFHQMRPFFDYMSDILTTDFNGESLI